MQSRIRLRKTGASGPSFRHSRAIPTVMHVFEELDIGITLWNGSFWEELHERPDLSSLIAFELEHGAEIERSTYNLKSLQRVERTKRTVMGRHGGFCDWFVPVCIAGRVDSVLVCGPFATERSSATDILERWRAITGRQGHPADPEFANYLSITLSTLVLEPRQVTAFQNAARVPGEADRLGRERRTDRAADRCIASSAHRVTNGRSDVDRRAHDGGRTIEPHLGEPSPPPATSSLGPDSVSRASGGRTFREPRTRSRPGRRLAALRFLPAKMRRARPQGRQHDRRPSRRARSHVPRGWLGAGRSQKRGKVVEIAESAVAIARRTFGLDVYLGVGSASRSLTSDYQEALAAAEVALARGQKTVFAKAGEAEKPFGHLQRELEALVDVETSALPARFDRYLETVAVRHGYQLEPARVQLEAAFEPLAESILGRGAVAARAFSTFRTELHRSAFAARR